MSQPGGAFLGFETAQANATITCTGDDSIPMSLVARVGLANASLRDNVFPATGGAWSAWYTLASFGDTSGLVNATLDGALFDQPYTNRSGTVLFE